MEPISIRMLKGAFFVLLSGHLLATLVLFFEKIEHQYQCLIKAGRRCKRNLHKLKRAWRRFSIHEIIRRYI